MMTNSMDNSAIDSAELLERLKTVLSEEIPIATLQLWANERIIPKYETYYKQTRKLKGRRPTTEEGKKRRKEREKELEIGRPGHYSAWPPETVEETAAVWAVRYSGIKKPKTIINKEILEIKEKAQSVYEYPFAYYELPDNIELTGPAPSTIYSYDQYKLKIVKDDDERNDLLVKWIAAKEKAKRGIMVSQPKKVIFHWGSILKPSSASSGLGEWIIILHEIALEDSNGDELVFLLDGMDSRKKVMYAPFNEYNPLVRYDPFEPAGDMMQRTEGARNSIIESRVIPGGLDYEAAEKQTVAIPRLTYDALVECKDILQTLINFKEEARVITKQGMLYKAALYFLQNPYLDPKELYSFQGVY